MADRKQHLGEVDGLAPDDVWDRIEAESKGAAPSWTLTDRPGPLRRVAIATVAVGVAAAGLGFGYAALRDNGAPSRTPRVGAVQVTNGRLAFTRRLPAQWNVFTIDPDGTDEQHVTHGPRDYSTSWSPDGSKIVVDRENGLTVMDADGSNEVVIADAAEGSFPSWSPDGSKILFAQAAGESMTVDVGEISLLSSAHLFVANADGVDAHQLTSGPYVDDQGVWSPDGSHIVFRRFGADERGLYVMNADGSDPVLVAPGSAEYPPYAPAWSPDGSRIAFTMNSRRGAAIYVMNADGSGLVPLTAGEPNFDAEPAWSPDGTLIAFSREISGPGAQYVSGDIYIMRADGSDVTQLTDTSDEDEQAPSWGTAQEMPGS
jgi:Tol biopolymer transport system component